MGNTVYVDKKHYDDLLNAYGSVILQRDKYRKIVEGIKDLSRRFDDRVLDDIHRFKTLEEENAYLIGAFNTMLAFRYDMEELEEKANAENRKQ